MAEACLAGFELYAWFGFVAPIGTSRVITDLLNLEARNMVALPTAGRRFAPAGIDLSASTPEELGLRIQMEIPIWTKIMRDAGIETE